MENTKDQLRPSAFNVDSGDNSATLGKYYTKLSLYEYQRQNPFTPEVESSEQAFSIINLPLPIQLYDRTASAFTQQNLGVVGDLFNLDTAGIIPAGLLRILESGGSRIQNLTSGFATRRFGGFNSATGLAVGGLINSVDVPAVSTSIQQLLGVTPNPNPVVKFVGPQLRSFNYTWYLSPKNSAESENLKKIIRRLKAASLPGRSSGNTNALLSIPYLAQMNFYPWDQGGQITRWGWNNSTSIIKMKRCHISNVSVNYNPANVPAFFHDMNPVIIELSLEFLEVEYLFQEDWEELQDSSSGATFASGANNGAANVESAVLGAIAGPIGRGLLDAFSELLGSQQ